ncbi:GeoRSP system PqqD family peptide chaperone [Geobacter sp.]|uniref:GeoRSP system PqqD family peptide chaperone n=1 Tax=Geobacter sp. TaxID=46610 RepID=UPI0027B994DE|nr:GeoRSP system PqqD family peptide chaperone [Geobacter sp.]
MQTIHRNPNVMWREETDALAQVQEALDRGDEVEETGTSVLFSGGTMLSLNYLGTEIWKLCDGRTMDGIVAELLPQFEVDEAVLREDVQAFLDELAAKGFISYAE